MPRNPKEIIEIIGEYGIKKRKKYPVENNKVLIEKPKIRGKGIKKRKKYPVENNKVLIEKPKIRGKGHSGWMPEFDKHCFLYYHTGIFPFKRLKRKLMVMDGASKCIAFKGKDDVKVPVFDRKTAKTLFEAEVIQHAGASTQKVTVPIFVYLLLFLLFMLGIVNILVGTGRIYF